MNRIITCLLWPHFTFLSPAAELHNNAHTTNPSASSTSNSDHALRLLLAYSPPPTHETRQRLIDIWNLNDKEKRIEALHQWLSEPDIANTPSDNDILLIVKALSKWCKHHCHQECHILLSHLLRECQTPDPIDSPRIRTLLASFSADTACNTSSSILAVMDAVNGTHADTDFSEPGDLSARPYMSRLWSNPSAYASSILSSKDDRHIIHLGYLLHDFKTLKKNYTQKGLQHWKHTYGNNLPASVVTAMQAMQNRHEGIMPDASTFTAIDRQTNEMDTSMIGFIVRNKLAVDPACHPWKPLDSPNANLFQMPDTSVTGMPQWHDSLLGKTTDYHQNCISLSKLAEKAKTVGSLNAILAFSLNESDQILPDNYYQTWLGVEGYDSFHRTIHTIYQPDGIDIEITGQGPRFSANDSTLRQTSHDMAVALHRCILQLARLEQTGQNSQLRAGVQTLADILNRYDLWPLLYNQYQLRGITPETYVALLSHFKGKEELLPAFATVARMPVLIDIARTVNHGKIMATTFAALMRDFLILNKDIPATEGEQRNIAVACLKLAREHHLPALTQYLCFQGMADIVDEWADIPPDFIGHTYSYTGFCLIRNAIARQNMNRAHQIYERMTENPNSYSQTATRLAKAAIEKAEGKREQSIRSEQDATILAFIQTHQGGHLAYIARRTLIDAGKLDVAEKILTLIPQRENTSLRRMLIDEYIKTGQYDAAEFHAAHLIHLACINSTPANNLGTQADITTLRILADTCRALSLLRQERTEQGTLLLETALASMEKNPIAALQLAPALLHCPFIRNPQRHTIRQRLSDSMASLHQPNSKTAQTVIAGLGIYDIAPARETTGIQGVDYDHYPTFFSKLYDWHLILPNDQETARIQASIVTAIYNSDQHNWIEVKHKDGRIQRLTLENIIPEDIDNLIDWKQQNNIRTWTRKNSAKPLEGMLVQKILLDDSLSLVDVVAYATPMSSFVTIRSTSGRLVPIPLQLLSDEDRKYVLNSPMGDSVSPTLQTFVTWEHALAYAETNHLAATAYVLGKRGGPEEQKFKELILNQPEKIKLINLTQAIVICYQDDHGNWDENALKIFRTLKPELDCITPPGSKNDHNPYSKGFAFTQEHGFTFQNAIFRNTYYTPEQEEFRIAIEKGDESKLKSLLAKNRKLMDTRFINDTISPLYLATLTMRPHTVRLLLENGADPNGRVPDGRTILDVACTMQLPQIVDLLLQYKADPNLRSWQYSPKGSTFTVPLDACRNNAEITASLLRAGAAQNNVIKAK